MSEKYEIGLPEYIPDMYIIVNNYRMRIGCYQISKNSDFVK